ncbi:hypothetical protein GGQ84_000895 [Desulfitispora alkaliphila]|uniref:YwmB family TATA-box binding protein n=1 Tax=Desulfitispora alkaliphila TaxID=622674 RepID=UPI003D1C5427
MKKAMLLAALLALTAGMLYQPVTATVIEQKSTGQVVEQVFNGSEAQLDLVSVEADGNITDEYLSVQELVKLAQKIINTEVLEPVDSWKQYSSSRNDLELVELTGSQAEWDYTIVLKSHQIGETRLVVTAETDSLEGAEGVVASEYRLKEVFNNFDIFPQFNICYQGTLKASLSGEEKEALVAEMFAQVNGEKTEGLAQEFLVSYSGYTPQIAETVETGVSEINLQIAARDHSDGSRTNIYVGYPLITRGY